MINLHLGWPCFCKYDYDIVHSVMYVRVFLKYAFGKYISNLILNKLYHVTVGFIVNRIFNGTEIEYVICFYYSLSQVHSSMWKF